MSSWSNIDNVTISGTVVVATANANAVLGISTLFTTNVKAGDYLTIAANKYQVEQVIDDTHIYLTNSAATNSSGVAAYLQTGPKYLSNIITLSGEAGRVLNVATIQNVFGVTLNEMETKQVVSTAVTNVGAAYSAAAKSNTTATIATTGLSQPTTNATATVFYSGTTVANVTITIPGVGYTTAAQANTTLVIATTGASQPTTNATATPNFTSSTESSNASHTGWVTYTTYVDATGSVREKSEVLVALSKNFTAANSGDAADDSIFPDS